MAKSATQRVRDICLALPEAIERETWGDLTWRVREKIFTMQRQDDGRLGIWFKAPPGSQAVLIGADPDRFFSPPYVGPKGWVGMWLDNKPDWAEVETLIRRAYRLVAPKKLVALLG